MTEVEGRLKLGLSDPDRAWEWAVEVSLAKIEGRCDDRPVMKAGPNDHWAWAEQWCEMTGDYSDAGRGCGEPVCGVKANGSDEMKQKTIQAEMKINWLLWRRRKWSDK